MKRTRREGLEVIIATRTGFVRRERTRGWGAAERIVRRAIDDPRTLYVTVHHGATRLREVLL